MATVQRAGFTTVETFGPFYENVPETIGLLRKHGLSAKSGHFSLARAEGEPDRVVEIAQALGIDIVVVPYILPGERPTGVGGWASLGKRLKAISDRLGPHGLRVAWHNHDFEFAALEDGSRPIEHVLGDSLLWEADLAWIVKGGAEPASWLERYRGRVPLVHVKDIAPAGEKSDEDGWADVGTGTLSWADLWHRGVAAGAEAMIAEHDNPSDFDRFARTSFTAMHGYAQGGTR